MTSTKLDFGAPVAVDELPERNTGGRTSTAPAFEAWLTQLAPGKWYELASDRPDGGHPSGRVAQIKKIAGTSFDIETRAIVAGKAYRIFAKVADAS